MKIVAGVYRELRRSHYLLGWGSLSFQPFRTSVLTGSGGILEVIEGSGVSVTKAPSANQKVTNKDLPVKQTNKKTFFLTAVPIPPSGMCARVRARVCVCVWYCIAPCPLSYYDHYYDVPRE